MPANSFAIFLIPGSIKRKNCRHRNSVSHHGYISKLHFLKAEAPYFLKTIKQNSGLNNVLKQDRLQDRKIAIRLYKHKTKLHKLCFSVFKNLFYDLKIYYILTFTCLVLKAHFGQSGKRAGVRNPYIPPLDAHLL